MLPFADLFAVVGVVLLAGLLLRWWAIITLGRFFTVDVMVEKDHEVVERGPFWWVRHPSYTGVLLAFLGWALSLGNWAAMLVVLVPIFAAFIHRMNVEEEALSRVSGQIRSAYAQDKTLDSGGLLSQRDARYGMPGEEGGSAFVPRSREYGVTGRKRL